MRFSQDGNLLATTGDDKELKVWDTESWSQKSARTVLKRINALQFTKDGTQIVEADKFGDVYS
jgi:tRNA (guanine-N(7)-)-methyltransferase subunit TRM82